MAAARQLFQTAAVRTLSIIMAAVLLTSLPAAGISVTGYAQASQTNQSEQKSQSVDQEGGEASTKPAVPAAKNNTDVNVTADTANDDAEKNQPTVSVTSSAPAGSINGPATPAGTKAASQTNSGTSGSEAGSADGDAPASENPAATTPAASVQQTNVKNNTDSNATSGNASVLENKKAGDATSGNASANATVVTVVGSGTGLGNAPITFVQNVYNASGSNEIQGNITIDPNTLTAAGSSSGNQLKLTQGSIGTTDIENNISLNAASGTATVADNGSAGNATSGDAVALANIINIVNSSVGSGRSFLGVVNIFGNLRGDILVPASFVNSLFASNGQTAAGTETVSANPPGSATSTTNITNNVDLNAVSGTASVNSNGNAGNATSGDAMTNLTVFNLTGREVVAKNSLLVFVNVMGKWVGMIVNAPAGSSAAAFSSGTGATAPTSSPTPGLAPGDHQTQTNITNNVSVNAMSGDATVSGNGEAGNATSGNAKAGANILNFVHSSFNLDDWFGALFINVIGSWLGNFGIADDTPPTGTSGQPTTTNPTPATNGAVQAVRVFQFNDDTAFTAAPASLSTETPTAGENDNPISTDDAQLASTSTSVSSGNVLGDATNGRLPFMAQSFGGNDLASLATLAAGIAVLVGLAIVISRSRRHGA